MAIVKKGTRPNPSEHQVDMGGVVMQTEKLHAKSPARTPKKAKASTTTKRRQKAARKPENGLDEGLSTWTPFINNDMTPEGLGMKAMKDYDKKELYFLLTTEKQINRNIIDVHNTMVRQNRWLSVCFGITVLAVVIVAVWG